MKLNQELQGTAYDKRCQRRIYKSSHQPKRYVIQTIDRKAILNTTWKMSRDTTMTRSDKAADCNSGQLFYARFGAQVSSKCKTWYSERVNLQFMCVGSWAGVTYLHYTVRTSPKDDETAIHCCDPALSVLVMFLSRNAFHVVSALQSQLFFLLICLAYARYICSY